MVYISNGFYIRTAVLHICASIKKRVCSVFKTFDWNEGCYFWGRYNLFPRTHIIRTRVRYIPPTKVLVENYYGVNHTV